MKTWNKHKIRLKIQLTTQPWGQVVAEVQVAYSVILWPLRDRDHQYCILPLDNYLPLVHCKHWDKSKRLLLVKLHRGLTDWKKLGGGCIINLKKVWITLILYKPCMQRLWWIARLFWDNCCHQHSRRDCLIHGICHQISFAAPYTKSWIWGCFLSNKAQEVCLLLFHEFCFTTTCLGFTADIETLQACSCHPQVVIWICIWFYVFQAKLPNHYICLAKPPWYQSCQCSSNNIFWWA